MVVAVSELMPYQLMPDLEPDEYVALKADIAIRGVLVPIELDEHGAILDGHHRLRACRELGIKDYPRLIRARMTEEQKRNHVRALNILRRHLSKEQMREQWEAMRADKMSYGQIAEASGVEESTVLRALSDSQIANAISEITNKRGQKRPTKYKPRKAKTVLATSGKEEQRAMDAIASAGDALPDNIVTTNRAARIGREQEAEERAAEAQLTDTKAGSATLLLGDFRERGLSIHDASVDLIFTDPPYPREFLPLWSDLSAFAARVLKPNGMLVAYTGALDLPEVLQRLGEHMRYWWAGSVVLDGPHSRVFARSIAQGCKPLLFYVKQGFKPNGWLEDTYKSEGEQKDAHEWQQSLGAALYYIEKLTPVDGVVVDPFLGGGTSGLAAVKLGRQFIGIELDSVAFVTAKERIESGQI